MRAKRVNESNINPYDKIGVMMAQDYGVDLGFEEDEDGLEVRQKDLTKMKSNKDRKDPFHTGTKNLKESKRKKKMYENLNEGTNETLMNIKDELTEFLKGVVIPQSKGHVRSERDAALHLYDILKVRYKIGN